MTVAEGSAGRPQRRDIYLMMTANLRAVPGLCLREGSNDGRASPFPTPPPPSIDCRPASRQVPLPFPTLPFPPVGPGIPVSHVLSARLQAPLRPARLPAPLLPNPPGPPPPMVSVPLCPIPQHLASTSLYTFHSVAFPSSQLDL